MEFPIALLAVAAFLFITGVVGRGANVSAPMGLKLGIEGHVGPFPRIIFVLVGSGVALAALVTFVLALPQPTPTPTPSPTPVVNPQGGGSSVNGGAGNANPGQTPATLATAYVLVGIRPQLGQVSEDLSLIIDNRVVASWHADQQQPTKNVQISLQPGEHSYQVRGSYSYLASPGMVTQRDASGSGSVTVSNGAKFGMNFNSGTGQFELLPVP